ncbi:hypothetical protein AS149_31895 [Burkholderia cenocepacia]|nr:hypothetical protein AS149_31895 [Burkholderia cenocepacia]
MTCSYGSIRTFHSLSTVHYRDSAGQSLPVIQAAAGPSTLENMQFEIAALRVINAQQKRAIAELQARLAEHSSGLTS